jgi:Glycosyl transferases group 1
VAGSAAVTRVLFVRTFVRPTGGNVTVRDFFRHALAYPRFDARIWFAPGSRHAESDLWNDVPAARVVAAPDWDAFDLVVVNGKDWRLLPESGRFRVLHLVQHLGYPADEELRGYLAREAVRVCVSGAVAESIRPYARGPIVPIPNGIDPALFREDGTRRAGAVAVWAGKAPELGAEIARLLAGSGVAAEVIADRLPRARFAERLRAADVLVALPLAAEGFYRPALEAMACCCAVVCSDARGNREHCVDGESCVQPPHGDAAAHAAAVMRLLRDDELRERVRAGGRATASRFSLAAERERAHALFDRFTHAS